MLACISRRRMPMMRFCWRLMAACGQQVRALRRWREILIAVRTLFKLPRSVSSATGSLPVLNLRLSLYAGARFTRRLP